MINFKNLFLRLKNRCWPEKYPTAFKIEITSRCNLRCLMCFHSHFKRPNLDMSFDDFKIIIDGSPNLKWVDFTGIGENFLNKDFLKMLRYTKSKKIRTTFYDNFCFINKKLARELIEIGVDEIFVSIDGATKETYENIRVGSNFETVINNVKNFFELKKELNANLPNIIFTYLVNKYNFGEMSEFVKLIYRLTSGLKTSIFFSTYLSRVFVDELEKIEIPNGSKIIKNTIQSVIKKGEELGIPVISNYVLSKAPISKCNQYLMPFIFVTGEIIPCCIGMELNDELKEMLRKNINNQESKEKDTSVKAYDIFKKMSLGNIFNQSFKEIWYGKKYKNFREMLRQGKTPSFCECCPWYKK